MSGILYMQRVADDGTVGPLKRMDLSDVAAEQVMIAAQSTALEATDRDQRAQAAKAASVAISAAVEAARAVEVEGTLVPEQVVE